MSRSHAGLDDGDDFECILDFRKSRRQRKVFERGDEHGVGASAGGALGPSIKPG